jgi:hypothetical protein
MKKIGSLRCFTFRLLNGRIVGLRLEKWMLKSMISELFQSLHLPQLSVMLMSCIMFSNATSLQVNRGISLVSKISVEPCILTRIYSIKVSSKLIYFVGKGPIITKKGLSLI